MNVCRTVKIRPFHLECTKANVIMSFKRGFQQLSLSSKLSILTKRREIVLLCIKMIIDSIETSIEKILNSLMNFYEGLEFRTCSCHHWIWSEFIIFLLLIENPLNGGGRRRKLFRVYSCGGETRRELVHIYLLTLNTLWTLEFWFLEEMHLQALKYN